MRALHAAIFLSWILAGCSRLPFSSSSGVDPDDSVLFRIGPVYLSKSELESRILEFGPDYVPYLRTSQGKKALVGAILKQKLLVRAALANGFDKHPTVKEETSKLKKEQDRARRLFHENILADMLINDLRSRELKVSEQELADYYNNNRLLYTVRHILTADRKRAETLHEEMRGKGVLLGREFARLAVLNSMESQSAKEGGRIPPFLAGELDDEFTRVAAGLEPGQVSGPVQTKIGYHLVYLENTSLAAFNDEYKERCRRILERKKLEKMMVSWKEKYVVEVRDESLRPFLGI